MKKTWLMSKMTGSAMYERRKPPPPRSRYCSKKVVYRALQTFQVNIILTPCSNDTDDGLKAELQNIVVATSNILVHLHTRWLRYNKPVPVIIEVGDLEIKNALIIVIGRKMTQCHYQALSTDDHREASTVVGPRPTNLTNIDGNRQRIRYTRCFNITQLDLHSLKHIAAAGCVVSNSSEVVRSKNMSYSWNSGAFIFRLLDQYPSPSELGSRWRTFYRASNYIPLLIVHSLPK